MWKKALEFVGHMGLLLSILNGQRGKMFSSGTPQSPPGYPSVQNQCLPLKPVGAALGF